MLPATAIGPRENVLPSVRPTFWRQFGEHWRGFHEAAFAIAVTDFLSQRFREVATPQRSCALTLKGIRSSYKEWWASRIVFLKRKDKVFLESGLYLSKGERKKFVGLGVTSFILSIKMFKVLTRQSRHSSSSPATTTARFLIQNSLGWGFEVDSIFAMNSGK